MMTLTEAECLDYEEVIQPARCGAKIDTGWGRITQWTWMVWECLRLRDTGRRAELVQTEVRYKEEWYPAVSLWIPQVYFWTAGCGLRQPTPYRRKRRERDAIQPDMPA